MHPGAPGGPTRRGPVPPLAGLRPPTCTFRLRLCSSPHCGGRGELCRSSTLGPRPRPAPCRLSFPRTVPGPLTPEPRLQTFPRPAPPRLLQERPPNAACAEVRRVTAKEGCVPAAGPRERCRGVGAGLPPSRMDHFSFSEAQSPRRTRRPPKSTANPASGDFGGRGVRVARGLSAMTRTRALLPDFSVLLRGPKLLLGGTHNERRAGGRGLGSGKILECKSRLRRAGREAQDRGPSWGAGVPQPSRAPPPATPGARSLPGAWGWLGTARVALAHDTGGSARRPSVPKLCTRQTHSRGQK